MATVWIYRMYLFLPGDVNLQFNRHKLANLFASNGSLQSETDERLMFNSAIQTVNGVSVIAINTTATADMRTGIQAWIDEFPEYRYWIVGNPDGLLLEKSMGASGTIGQSWTWVQTLADIPANFGSSGVLPTTVTIPDGVYTHLPVPFIKGTSENPITYQPEAGATVVLDANTVFNNDCSHTIWKNIVFRNSSWSSRVSAQSGSTPTDISTNDLRIAAQGIKLINCVIHDLFSPGFWTEATSAELYGCVIFNNGWTAPDRGHGHGIYAQNSSGVKLIKDCIIFQNFGWGIHAYSSNSDNLVGMEFIGNTCFTAGILHGTGYDDILIGAESGVVPAPKIQANMTYGALSRGLRFYVGGAEDVTLEDNYFPNGKAGTYTAISESGNNWTTVGNQVFVRGNDYDVNRANITIYNQAQANTVQVNVSSVLNAGDSYRLRNVQDYFVDIQTGTVAQDGTITVDMQASNRSVQAPVQWTAPATTFPDFGCFVLEKTS